MTRLAPRMKINKDATSTLSGIPVSYLFDIFTAASVHHAETEEEQRAEKAKVEARAKDDADMWEMYANDLTWAKTVRDLIDTVLSDQIIPGYENVRVQINKNGCATLYGVEPTFLNSIFTAAALHLYDVEKDHRGKYDGAWVRTMRMLIDSVAKSKPYRHGYENVPVTKLDKLGRFCRLREVRHERDRRIKAAEFMDFLTSGDQ